MAKKKKKKGLFAKLLNPFVQVGKAIAKVGSTVYTAASFVILAPFKGAMKKALDKKKIKHGNSMKEISELFVKHIVKGNKHYEGMLMHFEDYEALENYHLIEKLDLDNYDADENLEDPDHIAPVVGAVITAVIDFFKNLKKKKESGQPMSKHEEEILKVADAGAAKADELIQEEQRRATGKMVLDNKILVIGGVILLLFLILSRSGGWKRA